MGDEYITKWNPNNAGVRQEIDLSKSCLIDGDLVRFYLDRKTDIATSPTAYLRIPGLVKPIKTIAELITSLDRMGDDEFKYCVNIDSNIIADWLHFSFNEKAVADKLRGIFDKNEIRNILLTNYLQPTRSEAKEISLEKSGLDSLLSKLNPTYRSSWDKFMNVMNGIYQQKHPGDTVVASAAVMAQKEADMKKHAAEASKTAGLEQATVQVTKGENALQKEFENLISSVFGQNIRHCPLTGGSEFYLKKPGKIATVLEKIPFLLPTELKISLDRGGRESPYVSFLDIFDGGKYHPIKVRIYRPDLMTAAQDFAKEYERMSGQKATIVQEYHTTDKPQGLESKLADAKPTALEQKIPFLHPEAVAELPQNELSLYKAGEMQLYTHKNKEHGYSKGTLRCELNSPKATETLLTLLKRLSPQSSSKLPASIDELSTMLAAATKEKQEIKLNTSAYTGNNVVFEYTDECYVQSSYTNREFGNIGFYFTPAIAGFILGMLSPFVSTPLGANPGTSLVIGSLLMFGGVAGSTGSYMLNRSKFCKNLGNPEKVFKLIQEEKAELSKMVDKKNKPFLITNLQKHGEQIRQHNKKLAELESVLQVAIQKNCVSITYSDKSQQEVLDYFNSLCTGKNEPKTINAEVMSAEPKPTTETLKPVPTIDEIILEQSWKKDENYGRRIDGRYELREFLGEGGMSKVYRAVTILSGKESAIKFEKPETSALKKKEKLIRILCGLKHDNLIATTDANLDNKPAYAVMDLIDGTDLGKILEFARENKETKQNLSLENTLSIARNIGEALQFLHSNGSRKIIHNDIKPSNIMIDEKGKAYLGDCDIADIERDMNSLLTGATSQKASGAGTIEYMAPERRGIVKAPISERSDIYSFGAVLYEMIAGQLPMTPNGLDKRTDMPEDLKQILCKCVAIQPEDRYQTMKEALEDLNKLQIESKPIKLTIKKSEEMKEAPIKEQPRKDIHDADLIEKIQAGLDSGRLSVEGAMDAAHLTMEDVLSANLEKLDQESQDAILAISEQALIDDKEPDKNELFHSAELPSAAELKEEEESEPLISPDDLDDDEKQLE